MYPDILVHMMEFCPNLHTLRTLDFRELLNVSNIKLFDGTLILDAMLSRAPHFFRNVNFAANCGARTSEISMPRIKVLRVCASSLTLEWYATLFGRLTRDSPNLRILSIENDSINFERGLVETFSQVPASIQHLLLTFDSCQFAELEDDSPVTLLEKLRQIVPCSTRLHLDLNEWDPDRDHDTANSCWDVDTIIRVRDSATVHALRDYPDLIAQLQCAILETWPIGPADEFIGDTWISA